MMTFGRLAAGDPLSLDESPDASVVVLTLNGLARPDEEAGDSEQRRSALEEFLSELDDIARHHGLEPIKLIGDEYYAAIGHERPYIDHAPRAIAFVSDAFDLAAARPHRESFGLWLSAGVASGPVTVGLTGTSRLVYDVWGITVRRADQLARRAAEDSGMATRAETRANGGELASIGRTVSMVNSGLRASSRK